MIHVYCYYNKKVPFYEKPIFDSVTPDDAIAGVKRSCHFQKKEMLQNFRDECDLYYLGTYDDVTGTFDLKAKPEFLVSLDQFLDREKEEKKDGSQD